METLPDRVMVLETRMNAVEKNVAVFGEIIKEQIATQQKLTSTLDKFDCTVDELRIAMVRVQSELSNNTRSISELQIKVDKVEENVESQMNKVEEAVQSKIKEVEQNVRKVDDKGKIDVVDFLKDNIKGMLFGGGAIAVIIYVLFEVYQHVQ